ncbi:hypothetical protein [Alicyclobacillus fastidiosus]|uniref:nucleotide-binding protein n=1 Tax=Alicyclobacillus fastidiosus TaxID=392011 RepID=UPI0023E94065|nr:hypothetical protein [Alicyclobacillus fastidiosus]GMA61183.1 hypothetical protein GCM10025859_16230 [Alicyclobacillus fastidiosus]
MASKRRRKSRTSRNAGSSVTESYQTIGANMLLGGVSLDSNLILVTSATSGEGKTSTVYNLGIVSAETGKNVLLVDADLRRPQLHRLFYIENEAGLSGIVGGTSGVSASSSRRFPIYT